MSNLNKNFIVSPENPNGTLVDWTAEEIAENDTLQQTLDSEQTARETEAQAKEDLKASAKAKLIAGEALTEEEANTIVI